MIYLMELAKLSLFGYHYKLVCLKSGEVRAHVRHMISKVVGLWPACPDFGQSLVFWLSSTFIIRINCVFAMLSKYSTLQNTSTAMDSKMFCSMIFNLKWQPTLTVDIVCRMSIDFQRHVLQSDSILHKDILLVIYFAEDHVSSETEDTSQTNSMGHALYVSSGKAIFFIFYWRHFIS